MCEWVNLHVSLYGNLAKSKYPFVCYSIFLFHVGITIDELSVTAYLTLLECSTSVSMEIRQLQRSPILALPLTT